MYCFSVNGNIVLIAINVYLQSFIEYFMWQRTIHQIYYEYYFVVVIVVALQTFFGVRQYFVIILLYMVTAFISFFYDKHYKNESFPFQFLL